jgi:chemotaxis methyl-accepting protein methylase
VSESIIQKARTGVYPESIAMDLSAERLQRFFQKADGGYQISKTIRDLCREQGILPDSTLKTALDPWSMTEPHE